MNTDSSDISLNIFSTPYEASDTKKNKKEARKRRRNEGITADKPPPRTSFERRTNYVTLPTARTITTAESSVSRNPQRKLGVGLSAKPKPSTKPKTVSFENDDDDESAGPSQKSQFHPKTKRASIGKTTKPHIKGLGLPSKSSSSKTINFDDEGDSGVEVEKDYHPAKASSATGVTSSLFGNNPEIPNVTRRVVNPVTESVFSTGLFKDLPIHPFMVSNLEQNLSLTKLTTVQQKSIPVILSGGDALVRSQTGSGKTLAYALPIVEALQKIRPKLPRSAGIKAIVVVPTRELALQTYELFVKLVKPFTWLVPGYLVGGEKRKSEKARLRRGITVLVGTPGRILDHVTNTEVMQIDRVQWLVLDEADRLLDMGYEKDVSSLVHAIDEQAAKHPDIFVLDEHNEPTVVRRQTILVSATLTSGVERLAGLALDSPTVVDAAAAPGGDLGAAGVGEEGDLSIPESLAQYYVITPAKLRLVTLCGFVVDKCQLSSERKMLVFMATQDMVDYHAELLSSVLGGGGGEDELEDDESDEGGLGVEFFKLHGSMSQKDRTECFRTFRDAAAGVLLCTDVAARGLDLPRVDWIVQYTAPCSVADYVHRVGRTARVGAAGSALIFLTTAETEFVRRLEDRRIRLLEMKMDGCLQSLPLCGAAAAEQGNQPPTVEAAATALQLRFENAVMERRGLHGLACKAYISFVRFYASYPKEGRQIFSFKNLHLGHHAKCFALRDPPSTINGIGRRKWQDDSESRIQRQRFTTSGPNKGRSQQPMKSGASGQMSRSKKLVTSEYSSGLPERKKKKT